MSSPTREMTASDIHDVYRMDAARPAKPAARKSKPAKKTSSETTPPAPPARKGTHR